MRYEILLYNLKADEIYGNRYNYSYWNGSYYVEQIIEAQKITPDLSKCQFAYVKDSLDQMRFQISGEIRFYKSDFELIKKSKKDKCFLDIFQNGVLAGSAKFNIRQTSDEDFKLFADQITPIDNYSLIDDIREKQLDFIGAVSPIAGSVFCPRNTFSFWQEVFYGSSATIDVDPVYGYPITFCPRDLAYFWHYYGAVKYTYHKTGALYTSVTVDFVRLNFQGVSPEEKPFENSDLEIMFEAKRVVPGIGIFPIFGYKLDETMGFTQSGDVWTNNRSLNDYKIEYSTARKFTDLIKFYINSADSTIYFDETGTETDSFYFLKSIYQSYFNNLHIIGLTDFLPGVDGFEKITHQTKSNFTWGAVESWLYTYGFFWIIEERTNGLGVVSKYFKLKHKKDKYGEFYLAGQTIDLANYKGKNWIYKKRKYEFQQGSYNRREFELKSSSPAHYEDNNLYKINFPNVSNISTYKIDNQTIYTDTYDIHTRRTHAYPEDDISKLVLLSCEPIGVGDFQVITDYTITPNGIFWQLINDPLSVTNMAYFLWDYPDRTFFNDQNTEADADPIKTFGLGLDRVKFNKKVKIQIPITSNIKKDLNFDAYMDYFGMPGEIISISQNAFSNFYELEFNYIEEIIS